MTLRMLNFRECRKSSARERDGGAWWRGRPARAHGRDDRAIFGLGRYRLAPARSNAALM